MGAAGIVLLLFVLDLAIQIPFGRSSVAVDILAILSSGGITLSF